MIKYLKYFNIDFDILTLLDLLCLFVGFPQHNWKKIYLEPRISLSESNMLLDITYTVIYSASAVSTLKVNLAILLPSPYLIR